MSKGKTKVPHNKRNARNWWRRTTKLKQRIRAGRRAEKAKRKDLRYGGPTQTPTPIRTGHFTFGFAAMAKGFRKRGMRHHNSRICMANGKTIPRAKRRGVGWGPGPVLTGKVGDKDRRPVGDSNKVIPEKVDA